jgi:hypothetical protein
MVGGWGAYDMGFKKWWSTQQVINSGETAAKIIWEAATRAERESIAKRFDDEADIASHKSDCNRARAYAKVIRKGGEVKVANKGFKHTTRFSDSSLYDEICIKCGATDAWHDNRLSVPCPVPDKAEVKKCK